jgi:hypothetical protein
MVNDRLLCALYAGRIRRAEITRCKGGDRVDDKYRVAHSASISHRRYRGRLYRAICYSKKSIHRSSPNTVRISSHWPCLTGWIPYSFVSQTEKIFLKRTVLGAVLLTRLFGGAIASHLRVDSPLFSHTLFGVYLGVFIWLSLWLRDSFLGKSFPFVKSPSKE